MIGSNLWSWHLAHWIVRPKSDEATICSVGFEHGVAIDAHLVGIAVALAGAVLAVAQEVRGLSSAIISGVTSRAGDEARQLVAGDLLAHEAVERLVVVERAHHVIAIAIGQRAIGVGVEVAVRVGVAGRVEPVLSPPLAVVGRGQVAIDHPLVGVGATGRRESRDIFSGVGGRPVRSKLTRRIRV